MEEENAKRALRMPQKNRPVLLKRIREIRKPRLMKGEGVYELGSLVIVTYKTTKEVKREKIRSFLRKAPCIRLCRAVYAFCQKHSLFDKNRELIDADLFSQLIQEIGGEVKVIPRTVIVNSDSVETLLDETRERVENEFSDIVRCCKELYRKASGEEDVHHIRSMLPKLKKRHSRAKKVAAFYEKWLKIDFSKSVMMCYRALRKVHSVVSVRAVM
jgi:uncharacterized protein (UPF0335 family)